MYTNFPTRRSRWGRDVDLSTKNEKEHKTCLNKKNEKYKLFKKKKRKKKKKKKRIKRQIRQRIHYIAVLQ